MSEWKHERSYQLKKNPNYWDKDTVKLEEINVNIVKETSTGVNLYDSDQADRVILSSEFVDKYKKNKPDEFKTKLDRVCISYALTRRMQRLKPKSS